MRAAAIQLNATAEKARNLERAADLVAAAAAAGAELVVLPEKWNLLGARDDLLEGAESIDAGPSIAAEPRIRPKARITISFARPMKVRPMAVN